MALDAGQLHALWALASTRFYVTWGDAVGNLAHTAGQ
ncbi:Transposase [Shigella dysenteriae 1617]|uniref:Transposase n=1 Tax=Shigella dysenteriae 1617 TaxID=754093 RepID=A0A0A6ZZR7_SHIDY|nr:Transposase [Shigella dysenteriae 1617]